MKNVRVYVLGAFILLFFFFTIYKLADIQLLSSESYGPEEVNLLQKSVDQRASEISLTNGRGMFVDRNKQPLNQYEAQDIVIFPFINRLELPEPVVTSLNALQPNWSKQLSNREEPIYLSDITTKTISEDLINLIETEKIPGILAVERTITQHNNLASHLLGIIRTNPAEFNKRYKDNNAIEPQPIGIYGLQKTFDSFLVSENNGKKLKYHVDGLGNPLLGINLRYQGSEDQFYPIKVQTTIDKNVQLMTESVLEEHQLNKGGVVLLDADTREVVAMASRPSINEQNPYKDNSLKNQMITTQFPGSVFKIVVAAAAIEHSDEIIQQSFDCNKNLYGDAPASRQLGILTFEESFAKSCNYTFGKIAIELIKNDPQILETYADKLGVLGPVAWEDNVFHYENFNQLPEEETGVVWGNKQDKHVERAIIQTAIGQKEVRVTPLAIANMVATIVNNGIETEVKAVDQLLYNNDTTMKKFKSEVKLNNRIKKETALKLKKMMQEVVDIGTGQRFSGLPIAGKSGTAETGKEGKLNHWFVGYFPRKDPEYVMVVVDLDQSSQNAKNYDVFHDIATKLIRNTPNQDSN